MSLERTLQKHRARLWSYAYNILGDSLAAEDVVQDVLNRYVLNGDHVEKPDAYLTRAVINKSINEKDLLRNRKEQYRGSWLPVPVQTDESIYTELDRTYVLNYSLLVLLERLNTKERAVFILKETYDFPHSEIARILSVEEEHSRQLLKRAKEKLARGRPSSNSTKADYAVIQKLTEAIHNADVEKVKLLLAEDVQTVSDGGTEVSAARNIIEGRDRTFKLLSAIHGKYFPAGTEMTFAMINHCPAILYSLSGKVFRCIVFETTKDGVASIFVIVNPDKLVAIQKK